MSKKAKLSATKRVPPVRNYTIDLTILNKKEEEFLNEVIQRDMLINKEVDDRVNNLRREIQSIRKAGALAGNDKQHSMCARCKYKFWMGLIPFADHGTRCFNCKFKVCKKCRYKQVNNLFLCSLCLKQRQERWLTGDWLHGGQCRGLIGSDLIRASLHDKGYLPKLREKTKHYLSFGQNPNVMGNVSSNYRSDHLTHRSVFKHCKSLDGNKKDRKQFDIECWLANLENVDMIEPQPELNSKQNSLKLKEGDITKCINSKAVINKNKSFHRHEMKTMKKKLNRSQNIDVSKILERKLPNQSLKEKCNKETNKKHSSRYLANEKLLQKRLILKKKEKLNSMNSNSSSDEEAGSSFVGDQQHCNENSSQLENCKTSRNSKYEMLKLRNNSRSQIGKRKLNRKSTEKTKKPRTSANLNAFFNCKNLSDLVKKPLDSDKKVLDSDKKQLSDCKDKNLSKKERNFVVKDEHFLESDQYKRLTDLQPYDINQNVRGKTLSQIKQDRQAKTTRAAKIQIEERKALARRDRDLAQAKADSERRKRVAENLSKLGRRASLLEDEIDDDVPIAVADLSSAVEAEPSSSSRRSRYLDTISIASQTRRIKRHKFVSFLCPMCDVNFDFAPPYVLLQDLFTKPKTLTSKIRR